MDYRTQLIKIWVPVQSILVALLTMACGVWLAQVTWFVVTPSQEIVAPKIKATSDASRNNGTNWLQVSKEVASREFFGDVQVQAAEEVEQVVDAPETKLNFTLQAVMAQGDGEGFAVIAQRSSAGSVFGVGDDLFGLASLKSVYGDRVIIDRNGQLETLRYELLDSGILQTVSSNSDDNEAETFQDVLTQVNQNVANGGDLQSQVQGMFGYVSQRANEDPEAFMEEMGLEPTNGGYQVTRKARQLQMVGLRPGDVVTSVNDMQVGDIQSDQVLLNQILQTGGELKIQIRRGSRSFTIYQSIPSF